jgi:putative MFS transporter
MSVAIGFINAGTLVAYVLVNRADRWGRRRVLTWTIAGYTVFTFLSGIAPNAYAFGLLQFLARILLIAEWATSQVMAAEEFPAARRGLVIGVLQGFTSLRVRKAGSNERPAPLMSRTQRSREAARFSGAGS